MIKFRSFHRNQCCLVLSFLTITEGLAVLCYFFFCHQKGRIYYQYVDSVNVLKLLNEIK